MAWMRSFRRFRSGRFLKNLDLSGDGLEHEADHANVRVWRTEEGDAVGMYHFDSPPDLPRSQPTIEDFLNAYASRAQSEGVEVVELDICLAAGQQTLKTIIKAPQEPSGLTYVGALTLPFRDHSFVIKIQCEEWGMTGTREAFVLDFALAAEQVSIADDGAIEGQWNADDTCYDDQFPDHPLSRVRRWLPRIQDSLSLSEIPNELAEFDWPA